MKIILNLLNFKISPNKNLNLIALGHISHSKLLHNSMCKIQFTASPIRSAPDFNFQSRGKSKLDNESPRGSSSKQQTTEISFNFFIALLVATNNSTTREESLARHILLFIRGLLLRKKDKFKSRPKAGTAEARRRSK